jgi:hypothetical protein
MRPHRISDSLTAFGDCAARAQDHQLPAATVAHFSPVRVVGFARFVGRFSIGVRHGSSICPAMPINANQLSCEAM